MGKNLVIVESPAKAKTINKILGKDYVVRASMGHVRDLPQKVLGVDVENGFKPEYVTIKGRAQVLKELTSEAKKCDAVYLAPDPDREGEAIAWHLQAALAKAVPDDQFFRVTYNEITAAAIREAFANPTRIDMNRVDAQQARRVLDRLVGYQVSPLLWRRIRGSKSAGRVQSVALRLVCEREREILDFKPQEFWLIGAKVRKEVDPRDPFQIRLARIGDDKAEVHNEEAMKKILADLDDRRLKVAKIINRNLTRKPAAPFITSTLQQAGSSMFGFTPSHTMRTAQSLYEGIDFGDGAAGLITYMRTDSVNISKSAQDTCREFVRKTYGDDFVPEKPNTYKSRGGAQEAHEAIRPTDMTKPPKELESVLKPEDLKLYTLIWNRFVASQMAPAKIAQRTIEIDAEAPGGGADATAYLFRATTSEVTFPGYMQVTGVDKKAAAKGEEDGDEVATIPPLQEGESLEPLDWMKEQKFTQPPPRFSEASLIRQLEENGVGRPSTYAQVLTTILSREYVQKEKRTLSPTELGLKVNDFLVSNLPDLFNVGFTAQMEEQLDDVERGKVEWQGMLGGFYTSFQEWLEKTKGPAAEPKTVKALLGMFDGVKDWAEPVTRGKRTYSDEKFIASIGDQLEKGKKPISGRQIDALVKMTVKYDGQIADDVPTKMGALGLADAYRLATAPKEPPRAESLRKLELLQTVKYDEPRTVGKRIYDDVKFAESLREQVVSGKRLSENQLRYLDRLVLKYADQIDGFEGMAEELGLNAQEAGPDNESGPLLELLANVTEWSPPVLRGKREWDDSKFHESLRTQFEQKKALSIKQRSSLKKMCKRYAEQIPDYEKYMYPLGLPPPGKPKKAKKDEKADSEETAPETKSA
jgi:DNA topoisomerase-1